MRFLAFLLFVLSPVFVSNIWAGPVAKTSVTSLKVVLPGANTKDSQVVHQKEWSFSELRRTGLSLSTLKVTNPEYRKEMSYVGFWLNDLLRAVGVSGSESADDIVFTCADGFKPNIGFADALNLKLFVAVGEARPRQFTPMPHGRGVVDPGPFYIIGASPESHAKFPWPFQVVGLEVVHLKQKFAKIYPEGAAPESNVWNGFKTFRNRCLGCHAINQQGGVIGPEFNIPKNITEYRDENVLREFIKNPASFRANSPMPAQADLSNEDLSALIDYLKHMKGIRFNAK